LKKSILLIALIAIANGLNLPTQWSQRKDSGSKLQTSSSKPQEELDNPFLDTFYIDLLLIPQEEPDVLSKQILSKQQPSSGLQWQRNQPSDIFQQSQIIRPPQSEKTFEPSRYLAEYPSQYQIPSQIKKQLQKQEQFSQFTTTPVSPYPEKQKLPKIEDFLIIFPQKQKKPLRYPLQAQQQPSKISSLPISSGKLNI
jgi:hypothetical protein